METSLARRLSSVATTVGCVALMLGGFGATPVVAAPVAYVATWAGWGKPDPKLMSTPGNLVTLDLATGQQIHKVPIARWPTGIAVSDDGQRVFVSSRDDSKLQLVDTQEGKVSKSCDVASPMGVALIESGKVGWLLVAAADGVWVYATQPRFDCTRDLVVPTKAVDAKRGLVQPAMIAVSRDRKRAFVTDYSAGKDAPSQVAVLAITKQGVARASDHVVITGHGNGPAVSVDGRFLYVPLHNKGKLAIYDLQCVEKDREKCYLEKTTGVYPINSILSQDGKFLFVLNNGVHQVAPDRNEVGEGTVSVIKTGKSLAAHEALPAVYPLKHYGPEGVAWDPCTGRLVVTYRDDREGWVTMLGVKASGDLEKKADLKLGAPAGAQGSFIVPKCSRDQTRAPQARKPLASPGAISIQQ